MTSTDHDRTMREEKPGRTGTGRASAPAVLVAAVVVAVGAASFPKAALATSSRPSCAMGHVPAPIVAAVCDFFDIAVGDVEEGPWPLLLLIAERDSQIIRTLRNGSTPDNDELMLSLLDLWLTAIDDTEGEVVVVMRDPLAPLDDPGDRVAWAEQIRLNPDYPQPRVGYDR